MLSVGIKYSMRDLICDAIKYCVCCKLWYGKIYV